MKTTKVDVGDILRRVPLEVRIRVAVEAYFLNQKGGSFFVPVDETGEPLPELVEHNRRILEETEELIDLLLREIRKWKKDRGIVEE